MATDVITPIQCPDRILFPTWAYSVVPWLAYAGLNMIWLSGSRPAPLGIAAVALALFGPGLALIPPLFGGHATFDAAETLALAAALSLAAGGIIGVALTWTQLGLQLGNYLGAMLVFTSLCLIIAYLRRGAGYQSPERERVDPPLTLPALMTRTRREGPAAALSLALAVMVLSGAAALAANSQRPPAGPYFTAFYLLNADGGLGHYAAAGASGEGAQLRYGITNREAAAARYQVCTRADGQPLSCAAPVQLNPAQTYEETVSIALPQRLLHRLSQPAGAPVRVDFVLLREGSVYRTLHLWLS